jgi:dUTP pyrophosphatase
MKLYIKCLNEYSNSIYIEDNETRIERADAGYDLYIMEDVIFLPNETKKIQFGIACMPEERHGYFLYPRSSIYKTPFRLSNSVGIIDYGYRGEICAFLDNISNDTKILRKGDRLFQLCAPNLKTITIEKVTELTCSIRGIDGFGSTDKKILQIPKLERHTNNIYNNLISFGIGSNTAIPSINSYDLQKQSDEQRIFEISLKIDDVIITENANEK